MNMEKRKTKIEKRKPGRAMALLGRLMEAPSVK
jgi:hypothetical protein